MGLPEARMKICVYGLWHLGSVTAACVADAGFETIGLDPDAANIANLSAGKPPLFEPGLAELVSKGLASKKLSFTTNVAAAVRGADVVWVSFDTPVDEEDRADVDYVKARVAETFPYLREGAVVLVSSQMPVGSIAALEKMFAQQAGGRMGCFACSPENLRLGKAIDIFTNPGRIVIGVRESQVREKLEPLLSRFCDELIWISVESAEMTKHALNSFLAVCITFINEIASISETVGADASEVERAIRTDPRVGTKTYLTPGPAFAGGTLARDVTFLTELAAQTGIEAGLLKAVVPSNAAHRAWALRRLRQLVSPLRGASIAILGLSYKPGTDALRRSVAVELCRGLVAAGAQAQVYDPVVRALPDDLAGKVRLCASAAEALQDAQALVVATEWPDFTTLAASDLVKAMARPLVLDQAGFLAKTLGAADGIEYVSFGRLK